MGFADRAGRAVVLPVRVVTVWASLDILGPRPVCLMTRRIAWALAASPQADLHRVGRASLLCGSDRPGHSGVPTGLGGVSLRVAPMPRRDSVLSCSCLRRWRWFDQQGDRGSHLRGVQVDCRPSGPPGAQTLLPVHGVSRGHPRAGSKRRSHFRKRLRSAGYVGSIA